MRKFKNIFLSFLSFVVLFLSASHAVCPVCTVAIGAGLEGARLLGVDDVITGIWAGGLTLSMFFWTAGWLKNKRGVCNFFWYAFIPFVLYFGFLGGIYLLPGINYGENTLWGMDKLLLGIIIGTIVFHYGAKFNLKLKAKNNNKVYFAFQKVIVPILFLVAITGVFAAILYI